MELDPLSECVPLPELNETIEEMLEMCKSCISYILTHTGKCHLYFTYRNHPKMIQYYDVPWPLVKVDRYYFYRFTYDNIFRGIKKDFDETRLRMYHRRVSRIFDSFYIGTNLPNDLIDILCTFI